MIFLTSTFLAGLGVNAYKKTQDKLRLEVSPDKMAAGEDADRFIADYSRVNINSFDIDELSRLPGIGEKLAQRIAEYHRVNGPFESKEELLQVKGISEKKFTQIKDLIVLK